MSPEHTYHVHVNAYELNATTGIQLVENEFFFDPFVPLSGSYAPPTHYSHECSDISKHRNAWIKALSILEIDSCFNGYIEAEVLSTRFSKTYDVTDRFRNTIEFPLSTLQSPMPMSTIRGSVDGVPKLEVEAGLALGMSLSLVIRRVLVPQAWRISLPAVFILYLNTLKLSTLASVIAVLKAEIR